MRLNAPLANCLTMYNAINGVNDQAQYRHAISDWPLNYRFAGTKLTQTASIVDISLLQTFVFPEASPAAAE